MGTTTQQRVGLILDTLEALRKTVEAAGDDGVPGGLLYAAMMTNGYGLPLFEKLMDILVQGERVVKRGQHYYAVVRKSTIASVDDALAMTEGGAP